MPKHSLFRSLSHRNFRLYFFGQGVSLIGTWMQQVAMSWLVFEMTGSSLKLSMVLFFGQIPSLFLSPLAGALIDSVNRHKMLLWTQGLAMVEALVLAGLALSGHVEVWQIMGLSLFLGIVTAFDVTARQTFLSQLVADRKDLSNAIALNSTLMNGARLIGPSLAALVLASTSAGVCFLLNGVSYVAVLIALLAINVPAHPARLRRELGLLKGMREGFTYVLAFVPVRVLLVLLTIASMAGAAYNVLLPEFAVRVLHGNAATLGLLSGAAGAGALAGAVFLAARSSVVGLGRWIAIGMALMGAGLMSFAVVTQLWQAMCALAVTGFGMMVEMSASNAVIQTIVDEDKRARVMSFYTMAFLGMAPLGSILAGSIAEHYGLLTALIGTGCACLAAAGAFALQMPELRRLVRPIYIRLNLLPPVAEGIDAASELALVTKE